MQVALDRVFCGGRRFEGGERVFRATARGIMQAAMRDRPGGEPGEVFPRDVIFA